MGAMAEAEIQHKTYRSGSDRETMGRLVESRMARQGCARNAARL